MAIREINGHLAIDRIGLAERWGVSLATLDMRLAHGHPVEAIAGASADQRKKWWWWLDQADAWMQSFEDRKRAALTRVDRTGDPDDLLTSAQAAQVLGYRSADSLQPGFLKLADEVEELPSGRKRRRWRRATVWAYADNRTGKGGTGAPRGNANPLGPARRQIDRTGDPDELVTPTEAARVLGYIRPASLPAALRDHADEVRDLAGGRKRRRWKRRTLWGFADNHGRN